MGCVVAKAFKCHVPDKMMLKALREYLVIMPCRRVHAEASQRRLEEAMRKKEQEDKEKAAQRYVRKDYK